MLIIGKTELESESFRVGGAYSNTIARLFALPVVTDNNDPATIDVVTKGTEFKPYKGSKKVYWNRKFIGFFAVGNVAQEWDGGKYKTRFQLKQCEPSDVPEGEIPVYRWRYDLRALSEKFSETDGAKLEAGRTFDPFANSWKQPTNSVQTGSDDYNLRPSALAIKDGGTGASEASIALLNLGGLPSNSRGVPFGVAPLGADGKVPATFLPSGGGGGGSTVVYPIAINLGGTNATDAATARQNLGAIALTDLPPYPTLNSLNGVSNTTFNNAIAALIPTSAIGAASGVAPLGTDSRVPSANLPAYPTLSSLNGVSTTTFNSAIAGLIPTSAIGAASGVAPLGPDSRVPSANLPTPPTLSSLGGVASSLVGAASGIAPLGPDSRVPSANLPAPPTLSSLGGVASSLIGAANGVAPLGTSGRLSALYLPTNNAFTDANQTFTSAQNFANGISVKGGSPPDLTTGIWQSVDANGFPRIWIVNGSATTNNRVKSITIANNGNLQLRHHNDNLTDGNVLEHTASGNVLTNGTLRPGGGTSNFSGASFLPGAIYFRSDINMLVYSDGTSWRRMDNNAAV
jgi:hypothetical protein